MTDRTLLRRSAGVYTSPFAAELNLWGSGWYHAPSSYSSRTVQLINKIFIPKNFLSFSTATAQVHRSLRTDLSLS